MALLTSWGSLEYRHALNDVGSYILTLDGDLGVVDSFVLDGQIEIRRRDIAASPAFGWYTDWSGFHRTPQRLHDEEGARNYIICLYAGYVSEDHRAPGADRRGSLGDFAIAR